MFLKKIEVLKNFNTSNFKNFQSDFLGYKECILYKSYYYFIYLFILNRKCIQIDDFIILINVHEE